MEAGGKAHPSQRTLGGKALVDQLQHCMLCAAHSTRPCPSGQAKITYVVVMVNSFVQPVIVTAYSLAQFLGFIGAFPGELRSLRPKCP